MGWVEMEESEFSSDGVVTSDAVCIRSTSYHCHSDQRRSRREESAVPLEASLSREKRYYVYIMASKSRVLYVGVTGFLMGRVLQHKAGEEEGFTRRYRVTRLVYFESFQYVDRAIARETEIKGWRREKKVALIERENPTWEDLAADWGKRVEMRVRAVRVAGTADSSPAEAGSE